ncbi:MAG: hypothetical protein SFU55_02415 [Methylophilus sp.]|nr:hypothetical protein [Methylophilus sp.]
MNISLLVIGFLLGAISAFVFLTTMYPSQYQIKSSTKYIGLAVFMIVPILAGLIYWKVGTPEAIRSNATASTAANAPPMAGAGHDMSDLNVMAEKLATKLQSKPDNGDGWALLAHTYVELRQHDKAVGAFEKAVNLIPNDAQLLTDYADALAVTHQGQFDAQSIALVEKALSIDPRHQKALLLAGTIAFNQKNYAKAVEVWQKLQPFIDPQDTMLIKEVAANISEAQSLIKK